MATQSEVAEAWQWVVSERLVGSRADLEALLHGAARLPDVPHRIDVETEEIGMPRCIVVRVIIWRRQVLH